MSDNICDVAGIKDLSELPKVVVNMSCLQVFDEDGDLLGGSRGRVDIDYFNDEFDRRFGGYGAHWSINWTDWYTDDKRVIAMIMHFNGPNPKMFTEIPEGKQWGVDEMGKLTFI